VGRRIGQSFSLVACGRKDLLASNDDCTDRNVSPFEAAASLIDGGGHESFVAGPGWHPFRLPTG
jgi:hypothetical protein